MVKAAWIGKNVDGNWICRIDFQNAITELSNVSIAIKHGEDTISINDSQISKYLNTTEFASKHVVFVLLEQLYSDKIWDKAGDITVIVNDTDENTSYPSFTYTASLSE